MKNKKRAEDLLLAWVTLSGMVKNTRITKGLMYNEAIVMLLLYRRYCEDGKGLVSVKEIIQKTRMLKSLVNRTVNSLEEKNLLERVENSGDKRVVYVKCVESGLDTFLQVHNTSLNVAQSIIDIIGEEDTDSFVRIVKKIENAGYKIK